MRARWAFVASVVVALCLGQITDEAAAAASASTTDGGSPDGNTTVPPPPAAAYVSVALRLGNTSALPADYGDAASKDVAIRAAVLVSTVTAQPPTREGADAGASVALRIAAAEEAERQRVATALQAAFAPPLDDVRVAGVPVLSGAVAVVDAVRDECLVGGDEDGPCGRGGVCTDPDPRADGDFVCACGDGTTRKGAACAVSPHLAIRLLLSDDPADLLPGFNESVRTRVAAVLSVSPSAVRSVALAATPSPSALVVVDAPAPALPALRDALAAALAAGLRVAGVPIAGGSASIVAPGVADECESAPCGAGQHCVDPDLTVANDFVCSCRSERGLTYPKVGAPTPSCVPPSERLADLASVFEALALMHGHTALHAAHNAVLHATHCNAALASPPPALHPTRLTVGGSELAGAAVGNTALLVGALLLQQLLGLVVAVALDRSGGGGGGSAGGPEQRALLGFPDLPLRVFVSLLPGTVFSSIGLLDSESGAWGIALGATLLFLWLGCLTSLVFDGAADAAARALGQHVWRGDAGVWRRAAPFAPRHAAVTAVATLALCTSVPHRFGTPGSCAGQRIFVGVAMLLCCFVVAATRPWRVAVFNPFCGTVYLLQALGWLLLAAGLYKSDGHLDHGLVDSSVAVRLASASLLLAWIVAAAVFRPGGGGGGGGSGSDEEECSTEEGVAAAVPWYKPLPALHAALASPPAAKAVRLSADAAWVFVAVAVAVHWAFLFGAAAALALHLFLALRPFASAAAADGGADATPELPAAAVEDAEAEAAAHGKGAAAMHEMAELRASREETRLLKDELLALQLSTPRAADGRAVAAAAATAAYCPPPVAAEAAEAAATLDRRGEGAGGRRYGDPDSLEEVARSGGVVGGSERQPVLCSDPLTVVMPSPLQSSPYQPAAAAQSPQYPVRV
eukprot:Rhum_TRINITY_DN15024_c0_g1::Rhum_TRINITY_DN15024_c0_g1_i1::g.133784::m.133784